jgi:hypothetical protein
MTRAPGVNEQSVAVGALDWLIKPMDSAYAGSVCGLWPPWTWHCTPGRMLEKEATAGADAVGKGLLR